MRLAACGVHRIRHNPGDIFVKLKSHIPHDIPDEHNSCYQATHLINTTDKGVTCNTSP